MNAMQRSIPLGLAVVLAAWPAQMTAQDFEWRGRIERGDEIEIKGVNGDVLAEFTNGDHVEVVATKRGRRSDPEEVEIEVVQHRDGYTISTSTCVDT